MFINNPTSRIWLAKTKAAIVALAKEIENDTLPDQEAFDLIKALGSRIWYEGEDFRACR